jgi:hypothetical protein
LWIAISALHLAEQLAGLTFPRKAGELIDGRDEEGGQAAINRFIDCNNRQRRAAGKFAIPIDARYAEIERLLFVWNEIEGVG